MQLECKLQVCYADQCPIAARPRSLRARTDLQCPDLFWCTSRLTEPTGIASRLTEPTGIASRLTENALNSNTEPAAFISILRVLRILITHPPHFHTSTAPNRIGGLHWIFCGGQNSVGGGRTVGTIRSRCPGEGYMGISMIRARAACTQPSI